VPKGFVLFFLPPSPVYSYLILRVSRHRRLESKKEEHLDVCTEGLQQCPGVKADYQRDLTSHPSFLLISAVIPSLKMFSRVTGNQKIVQFDMFLSIVLFYPSLMPFDITDLTHLKFF
jgi:hypothetical protein